MLNKISEYLNDNTFKLTLYEDKLHIINYQRIITLENNYVKVSTKNKKILILGDNLSLKKIVDNELLVSGNISKIEVSND